MDIGPIILLAHLRTYPSVMIYAPKESILSKLSGYFLQASDLGAPFSLSVAFLISGFLFEAQSWSEAASLQAPTSVLQLAWLTDTVPDAMPAEKKLAIRGLT
jgi:hypothetical protein